MKLGIITVTFNANNFINPFLECCLNQEYEDFKLIIIDNASTDSTINVIQKIIDPRVNLIINNSNIGYSAACNQGIKILFELEINQILLINNDTEFECTLFGDLIEQRKLLNAGAITPRIVYFNDTNRNWYAGGAFQFWKGFQGKHIGEGKLNVSKNQAPFSTEVAPGCCILFSSSVFESIGLFDETYFVYFEDTDFFLRMKYANLSLFYAPNIVLKHKVSLSTGGSQSQFSIRFYQRNQIYLIRKHFNKITIAYQILVILLKTFIRLAICKDKFWQTKLKLKSMIEGFMLPINKIKT